jgi:hypothetical protein
MTDVDGLQNDRLDRLDGRLRAVEEVVIELRTITKMVKPVLLLLAASLGVDVAPMLV